MRITLILGACVAFGTVACTGDRAEANKQIVQRMVEAVNARDFDALDTIIAPTMRRHSAATPDVTVNSREEFKAFVRQGAAAVPDSEQEVVFMVAEDDRVAVYARYSGTQQGAMGPLPATGRTFSIPFMGMLRIENDQIAEMWVEWDNLNMLTQLGLFPPPPPDSATVGS